MFLKIMIFGSITRRMQVIRYLRACSKQWKDYEINMHRQSASCCDFAYLNRHMVECLSLLRSAVTFCQASRLDMAWIFNSLQHK